MRIPSGVTSDTRIYLYDGKRLYSHILQKNVENVPTQTKWNVRMAWERLYKDLPKGWTEQTTWNKMIEDCFLPGKDDTTKFANSWEVFRLRKLLQGLVIGPLDKNNGELSLACLRVREDRCAVMVEERRRLRRRFFGSELRWTL